MYVVAKSLDQSVPGRLNRPAFDRSELAAIAITRPRPRSTFDRIRTRSVAMIDGKSSQGRKIADGDHGAKNLTNDPRRYFCGRHRVLDEVECVAIVEAPIELSLAAAGIPSLATQGTTCPDWLPLVQRFALLSWTVMEDNDDHDGHPIGRGPQPGVSAGVLWCALGELAERAQDVAGHGSRPHQ
jgi:hypothetical protein